MSVEVGWDISRWMCGGLEMGGLMDVLLLLSEAWTVYARAGACLLAMVGVPRSRDHGTECPQASSKIQRSR